MYAGHAGGGRHARADPARAGPPVHQGAAELVPVAARRPPRAGRDPRLAAGPAQPAAGCPFLPRCGYGTDGVHGDRHEPRCRSAPSADPAHVTALPVRAARHASPDVGRTPAPVEHPAGTRAGRQAMSQPDGLDGRQPARWRSSRPPRARPLALEAIGLSKDFRLGRGQVLHAVRDVSFESVPRRGRRAGRRERLGQVHGRPAAGRAGAADLRHDPARRRAGRPAQPPGLPPVQEPGPAGLPGPVLLAQPRPHRALSPGAPDPAAPGPGPRRRGAAGDRRPARAGPPDPAGQFLGKYPHELSGGQRQRVSFARALAARPERAARRRAGVHAGRLDPAGDAGPARRPAASGFQLALLYITHDIASARYFADEILVMYAGQIVERGPAEELTQQPGAPLHPAAGRLGARPRQPRQRAARGRRRRRAASRSATGAGGRRLPVQRPVPVRRGPLPQRRTRRCSQSPPAGRLPAGASTSPPPGVLAQPQGGGT